MPAGQGSLAAPASVGVARLPEPGGASEVRTTFALFQQFGQPSTLSLTIQIRGRV